MESSTDKNNLFKNVTLQDALTVFMVYAAQPDPHNAEDTIRRIKAIAESNEIFIKKKDGLNARIQHYINGMQQIPGEEAIQMVVKELAPGMRNLAFKLAVEVALTEEKERLFKMAERVLDVDIRYARLSVLQAVQELF